MNLSDLAKPFSISQNIHMSKSAVWFCDLNTVSIFWQYVFDVTVWHKNYSTFLNQILLNIIFYLFLFKFYFVFQCFENFFSKNNLFLFYVGLSSLPYSSWNVIRFLLILMKYECLYLIFYFWTFFQTHFPLNIFKLVEIWTFLL